MKNLQVAKWISIRSVLKEQIQKELDQHARFFTEEKLRAPTQIRRYWKWLES